MAYDVVKLILMLLLFVLLMLLVYICIVVVNADEDVSFDYDNVNIILFRVLTVAETIVTVMDVVVASNDVDDTFC